MGGTETELHHGRTFSMVPPFEPAKRAANLGRLGTSAVEVGDLVLGEISLGNGVAKGGLDLAGRHTGRDSQRTVQNLMPAFAGRPAEAGLWH
jgi:hypothetical protein